MRSFGLVGLIVLTLALAACSSQPRTVQVVDRTTPAQGSLVAPKAPRDQQARSNDEDTYVVRRGDTLYQISLDHGQDWRDIAKWSSLDDPNQLRVGQVLRVRPPSAGPSVATSRPPENGPAQTAPVTGPTPAAPRPLDTPVAPVAPPVPTPPQTPSAPPKSTAPVKPDAPGERVDWAWPASGKVIETFSESRNKGLDIAGTPGDPILAAADGKVVYSGNGLRGYGNLIIIKHNSTYLSAYAHNRSMVVKEGQTVRRGQKIAELGQTDTESPRLHFEIRKLGKPIDPVDQLPQR